MSADPGSSYGSTQGHSIPRASFLPPDALPAYQYQLYHQQSHDAPYEEFSPVIPHPPLELKRESPDPSAPSFNDHIDRDNHGNQSTLGDIQAWLRQQDFLSALTPEAPIHLDALLSAREDYDRPPYTMNQLAAVAIASHPRQKASSAEIRDMLMNRYPYFRENAKELGVSHPFTI